MTALQVIDKDVLIETLVNLTDPDNFMVYPIQDLVDDGSGNYKIFWEHVNQEEELPYITLTHLMGGRLKDNHYSDTTWKVVGHTASMNIAQDFANAISLLDHHDTIVPDQYPGVCGYTYIEEYMPIFDRYQVQNTPLFMVGGLYRLRLNLGDF